MRRKEAAKSAASVSFAHEQHHGRPRFFKPATDPGLDLSGVCPMLPLLWEQREDRLR